MEGMLVSYFLECSTRLWCGVALSLEYSVATLLLLRTLAATSYYSSTTFTLLVAALPSNCSVCKSALE